MGNEAGYKARIKKDPGYAMGAMNSSWMWFTGFNDWNGVKMDDVAKKTPLKAINGAKSHKAVLLWPNHMKGRPAKIDQQNGATSFVMTMVAKGLKTSPIQSHQLSTEGVIAELGKLL